jgi:hypothetical protein
MIKKDLSALRNYYAFIDKVERMKENKPFNVRTMRTTLRPHFKTIFRRDNFWIIILKKTRDPVFITRQSDGYLLVRRHYDRWEYQTKETTTKEFFQKLIKHNLLNREL